MRHLTREKAQGWRLLDGARTIAVLDAPAAPRHGAILAYLRRVGYDVRPVRTSVSKLGGPVDLVLVLGIVPDVAALLRDAAAKRADGVWFLGSGPTRAERTLARDLGLVVVHDADIVIRHEERLREAGQPRKLGARPRRRGRPEGIAGGRQRSRTGWTEAGGGGQRGGGGGRAALDEKKMTRRRRSRAPARRAA
jgi:predicted CoA-binding protein